MAQTAEGKTSPNPMVGAVVVKNDKIVGCGCHQRAGTPHAEAIALDKAGKNAKGSTLYLNMEPCCHFGRTPPCTEKVIKSGVKRVVAATQDPNPLMQGKSFTKLKKAGVHVCSGVCHKEGEKLNEVFFKNMREKMPFVAVKIGQSLDGKITTSTGRSHWITGEPARQKARGLRDKYDCVLVGVNTANLDNPTLNGLNKNPFKAVIDPQLKLKPSLGLIKANGKRLFVITRAANKNKKSILEKKATLIFVAEKNGRLDLKAALKELYRLKVCSIFVEGGSATIGAFFDAGLVDKLYFFIAPKIIGGTAALSSVGGRGVRDPQKSRQIKELHVEMVGDDLLVSGYPRR